MRSQRLLWLVGAVVVAAVLGMIFHEPLAQMGIGPQVVFLVALLAAVAVGWFGPLPRRPGWIVIWLLLLAGLGLAYNYVPGVPELFRR